MCNLNETLQFCSEAYSDTVCVCSCMRGAGPRRATAETGCSTRLQHHLRTRKSLRRPQVCPSPSIGSTINEQLSPSRFNYQSTRDSQPHGRSESRGSPSSTSVPTFKPAAKMNAIQSSMPTTSAHSRQLVSVYCRGDMRPATGKHPQAPLSNPLTLARPLTPQVQRPFVNVRISRSSIKVSASAERSGG
jgi:hypothetical protein